MSAPIAKKAKLELPIFTTAAEMRAWSRDQKRQGKKIAFVPTMGYLHEGHISLVKAARDLADVVVSSIYVNPTQFSVNEDFDVYPRETEKDRAKLSEAGCDAIFEPSSLYHQVQDQAEATNVVGNESSHPDAHETYVQVERLQLPLCGKSRPHFFRGVATVVTKLFHIVEPDVAVFGKKDYQQFRVITRMVRDLDFPVEVVGMPICREDDGLAMSSRNARLSEESRSKAPGIYKALLWARDAVAAGAESDAARIQEHVSKAIEEAGGKVDYVSWQMRSTSTLSQTHRSSRPSWQWLPTLLPRTEELCDSSTTSYWENRCLHLTAPECV